MTTPAATTLTLPLAVFGRRLAFFPASPAKRCPTSLLMACSPYPASFDEGQQG